MIKLWIKKALNVVVLLAIFVICIGAVQEGGYILQSIVGIIGAIIVLFGIVIQIQGTKIEGKVSKDVFREHSNAVDGQFEGIYNDLNRGSEKIERLSDKIGEQKVVLGRIDERVEALARKNGIKTTG